MDLLTYLLNIRLTSSITAKFPTTSSSMNRAEDFTTHENAT